MRALITRPTTQGCNFNSLVLKNTALQDAGSARATLIGGALQIDDSEPLRGAAVPSAELCDINVAFA